MINRRSVYSSWDEVLHKLDTLKNKLRASNSLSAEEKLREELLLESAVISGCEAIRDSLTLSIEVERQKTSLGGN